MPEISVGVQIERRTAESLSNQDWVREQSFKTREPIVLHGQINGEHRGSLSGTLIIERSVVGSEFEEKSRYANLGSVSVYPGEMNRQKGLGSLMVREFENIARRLGAVKMVGEIGSSDYNEEPWLPVFYEKLGFKLTKKGEGFIFEKDIA